MYGVAYIYMDKRAAGFIVAFLLLLLISAVLQVAGARHVRTNRP